MERVQIFSFVEGLKIEFFRAFSSRGSSLMQSIAETCVRFDAAHLSINLVSEIAVPMFPTLRWQIPLYVRLPLNVGPRRLKVT